MGESLHTHIMHGRGPNPDSGYGDFECAEDEVLKRSRVVDLLHMEDEQRASFSERVANNNHAMIVAVHPFYDINSEQYFAEIGKESPHPISQEKVERNKRLVGVLSRLLSKDPAKTPPVAVFEETDYVKSTSERLSANLSEGNNVYMVQTMFDNAVPVFENEENLKYDYTNRSPSEMLRFQNQVDEIAIRNFSRLAKILQACGVESIYIGGMNLEIQDTPFNQRLVRDDGKPTGVLEQYISNGVEPRIAIRKCVASVYHGLSRYFPDVQISNFTSPNTRRDLRSVQDELGQI